MEEMLSLTLVLAQELGMLKQSSLKTVIVDTTVMPKAIAHPTDSRLLERTRQHLVKAARACGLKLRQSYSRVVPSWRGRWAAMRMRDSSSGCEMRSASFANG